MDVASPSADAVTGDIEILKKMEDEHLRLQRQVRAIQSDRNNRKMGVHPQFRRQDQLLKVLNGEYLDLIKDLKIASTGAHKKKDKRMKVELRRALLLRTKTEQDHDAGITLMDQLEELLQRNNKQALHLKKLVSNNMGQILERRAQSEKRLVSTENRLETAKLRFNVVQCENKKIREEIECMLKDRALFNQAWGKMIKVLCKGKKFLQDLFESSTVAYDLRDEWCSKLRSMQEKGKMDQLLQIEEMRDLQKAFDHEMKLFNFLAAKGVIRVNTEEEQREEEEKKKVEEKAKKQLQEHNNLLDEITEYSEEETISKIIECFEKKEQENFAVYQLLTEHCAENVRLKKELATVQQEIRDRYEWNEVKETKLQDYLEDLRGKIEVQQTKNENLRQQMDAKEQLIVGALAKIAELFKMLGCSLEPYQSLLGDKLPSSRWQLNLTMFLVTEKIKEYLEIVYYAERGPKKGIEKRQEKKLFSSRLKRYTVYPTMPVCWKATPISLLVPADPCPACVSTRWLSRVTEAAEQPLNRQATEAAIRELSADPAYVRSDRIHPLNECRVPSSRLLLAARHLN